MKTKVILLLCLFVGIATTQLSAQNGKNGTGSIVYTVVWTPENGINVFCDGTIVDHLIGDLTIKENDLFKNGDNLRGVGYIKGELISDWTGEVFKVNWHIKGWAPLYEGNYTNNSSHFNLIGNMGNHYIGGFSYIDGQFTILREGCFFEFP